MLADAKMSKSLGTFSFPVLFSIHPNHHTGNSITIETLLSKCTADQFRIFMLSTRYSATWAPHDMPGAYSVAGSSTMITVWTRLWRYTSVCANSSARPMLRLSRSLRLMAVCSVLPLNPSPTPSHTSRHGCMHAIWKGYGRQDEIYQGFCDDFDTNRALEVRGKCMHAGLM